MYSGGSDSGKQLRAEQLARENQMRETTNQINQVFGGYGPGFYKAREQAYLNFALPELSRQYQETRKNLVFNLANRGLLQSNVGGTLASSLDYETNRQKQAVADTAIAESNKLREQMEQARSSSISLALAGLEPSQAYSSALETASRASSPSPFVPVGQFFNDWSRNYLASKQNEAYQQAYSGMPSLTYPSAGKVRTVWR